MITHLKTGAGLVVTALLTAGLALTGGTAHAAAPTRVELRITGFGQMLVDGAHRHLFISEEQGNGILVTDFDGRTVTTIGNEPGAGGMTLSPDGSAVDVALSTGNAVSVISTTTLAETARYSLGTGNSPGSVAVAGGRIWVGYTSAATGLGQIASIDPGTSPASIALGLVDRWDWSWGPLLATSSAAPDALVATSVTGASEYASVARYDITSGTPVKAAVAPIPGSPSPAAVQITPDGQDVVVATESGSQPAVHPVFKLSDLTADGTYPDGTGPSIGRPNALSVSPDGYVAVGTDTTANNGILVYAPHGTTPLRSYPAFGWNAPLAPGGLAWAPDGSRLFAMEINNATTNGWSAWLHILIGPLATDSTLSLTGPTTAPRAGQLALTGSFSSAANVPAGTHLQVTRTDPADPNGVSLPDAVTAADGTFTIQDTPQIGGTNSYQVSFPGTEQLLPATAAATVEVSRIATAISLAATGSGTFAYGASTTLTAHLGTSYTNRSVAITETVGSNKPVVLKAGAVDSHGNLAVTVKLTNSATFTASFAGDYRYAPAAASRRVFTHAAVTDELFGYYGAASVSGHWSMLYHHTDRPNLYVLVSPNKRHECLRFVLQESYSGSWHTVTATGCFSIDYWSTLNAYVRLASNSTNHLFRYASEYVNGSDTTNLSTWGNWQYFYVRN